MRRTRDYLHHYTKRGCTGIEGCCRVRIYVPAQANVEGAGRPVIVCSEPPMESGYSGPSITNEAELVAASLMEVPEISEAVGAWQRSSSDALSSNAPVPFHFVEHYPSSETERRSGMEQTFDLLTFGSYEPTQKGIAGNSYQVLGEPEWSATTREFVEALTGDLFEPAAEASYFEATGESRANTPGAHCRIETAHGMLPPLPWDPGAGNVILRRIPEFEAGPDTTRYLRHRVQTNVPWSVVEHSPDGFEWSYAGSGPSDLALNILNAFIPPGSDSQRPVRCFEGEASKTAAALHQCFKEEFLAGLPAEGGTIPGEVIRAWIEARIVRVSGEIVGHVPQSGNE